MRLARFSSTASARALYVTGASPDGQRETLLGSRYHHVHAPQVGGHLGAAERDHGVRHEQRVVGAGEPPDLRQGLEHARRRLAVDHGHHARAAAREGARDGVGLDDPPPLRAHRYHVGAAALGDLDHEQAEAATLPDHHAVTRLEERDHGRLQPGPARARHRKGALVPRLEDHAEEIHHLVHDRGELRIELAQERGGHGAEHARVGHGGPGPQQDARTREEIARRIGHDGRV